MNKVTTDIILNIVRFMDLHLKFHPLKVCLILIFIFKRIQRIPFFLDFWCIEEKKEKNKCGFRRVSFSCLEVFLCELILNAPMCFTRITTISTFKMCDFSSSKLVVSFPEIHHIFHVKSYWLENPWHFQCEKSWSPCHFLIRIFMSIFMGKVIFDK